MKKRNPKKVILQVLLSILLLMVISSTYLAIDTQSFKEKLKKMETHNGLTVPIKSVVKHKTLKQDGYTIHYYVSGNPSNELIVFLHPAFSDHRAYDQQLDFFSNNYYVITIDMIGHGESKANNSKDKIDKTSSHINQILEIEGHEKGHFAGTSMGSLIAQYYALQNPEKVKSLTLVGSYDINKESNEIAKAQRGANFKLIFRALYSMDSFRKKTALLVAKTERAQALFYKSMSFYKRSSFLVMQGLQNVIKKRPLHQPTYPMLIIVGEFDLELVLEKNMEWHSEIENSQLTIIKGAGHCANMDMPEEFNNQLMNFINSVKPSK